jgi:hypothetical protein
VEEDLLSVNEGVQLELVINKARVLVSTARETFIDLSGIRQGAFYAAFNCLELAEALLNSVEGDIPTDDGPEWRDDPVTGGAV